MFILNISPDQTNGYFDHSRRIVLAYERIQDFYLADASKLLQAEARQAPKNVAVEAAMAALIFAEATARDEDVFTKQSIIRLKKIQSKINNDTASNVHHLIAEVEIAIYCGLLQVRLNNRLRAASEFLTAYTTSKNAYKMHPQNPVVKLLWGNMIATIGSLPPELRKYLSFVGYTGDVKKGVDLMKEAHRRILNNKTYKIYSTRANILFLISAKQLVDNEEILPESFGIDPMENYVTAIVSAKVLMEQGYNDTALKILKQIQPKEGQFPLHYFHYLFGKGLLAAGDSECETSLLTFLQNYKGMHHVKAAHRLLAWHYLLANDIKKADSLMALVPTVGLSVIGPDQQAERDAEERLNLTLIRSRILFDGGYLDEALEILLSDSGKKCCKDPIEMAEYHYRLGRVYQNKGWIYPAIENFEKAFSQHQQPAFNRANSALQAALLYEKLGIHGKATYYYSKCLELKNFPYQEGIHQKAKAGLIRMGAY
ncbi:tetratricopeptide repeat protein [Schleiferia thermophila]|uniref:Tetratricopeptide repeat protein n=1 Tax=Schleiferia thermophila TaxID=884107 RepID=A0A369A426_9FLAO|nr:hypothetical protein [Schleiferia thermophila]KFD39358.1 hypothetical protein AT05_05200 [Schleiferia thermophila str. Yellowstone]RCX03158.1 tetratricopeptide repeat protein [Schleiferia thermophila]GCD80286.1 hypothetical protein JCM30197_15330 [Schleiferia thermophila]